MYLQIITTKIIYYYTILILKLIFILSKNLKLIHFYLVNKINNLKKPYY